MLWIGSRVAVVPIGAPQLSQKAANETLAVRHDGQMISSALVSDSTRHLKELLNDCVRRKRVLADTFRVQRRISGIRLKIKN